MPTSNKKARRPREREKTADLGLTSSRTGFPIVAVGASAGGLEAFSALLRALPSHPGLALVFVTHLDPTHESAMVELLARTTTLPVHQAADGMAVARNKLYVLPPNSDMTIRDGVLHLVKRTKDRRTTHAGRHILPFSSGRPGAEFGGRDFIRHRKRRNAWPTGHKKQRRPYVRSGQRLRKIRWHAHQCHFGWGSRFRVPSRAYCSRIEPNSEGTLGFRNRERCI